MQNKLATVSQILPFSCVDGPGSRLVIFLQGCNYNCKNCHNPHTIDWCDHCGDCISTCPTQALTLVTTKGISRINWNSDLCTQCDICLSVCPKQSSPKTRQYGIDSLVTLIHHQRHFINGITVSGGEASLQLPFIIELFKAVKSTEALSHLTCMIDTNGSLSISGWHKLLPVLDGAMIDLKAWQEETHRYITGRDHHRVFQSLELLSQHAKLYEVRLLHIPNISDFDFEIEAVATYLKQLPNSVRIKLNAFQHHGVTGEARQWGTCSEAQMLELAARLTERGVTNLVLPNVYL